MNVNYLYWADMDYWTVHEAACLLNRIDPHDPIDTSRSDSDLLNDEENVRIYKELISRASKAGTIKTLSEDGDLDPQSVIDWAEKKRIEVPYKLLRAMGLDSASNELRTDHVDKEFAVDGPVAGSESQELGRLRQERDKWESSIKSLTLQYENDESIIIKSEPGSTKKIFRYDDRDLNFKNNRTKEWNFLLRVLKSKQPFKVNDRERRLMRKVEEKLKNLIGNLNHIDIPKDYELFYHDKKDERGCYRTRFNTSLSSQNITFINEDDFMDQFTELLGLINTKKVDASTETTFFKFLELGKQNKYLSDEMYEEAQETYKEASARHGEIESIPRGDAIKNDPDLS